MKRNIKILSFLAAIVMCLSLFSACTGKNANAAQEAEKAPEKPELHLSLEELPVIDGATAFLPYYRAVVAEITGTDESNAGEYVLCSTTDYAYPNLVDGQCDMVYCLRPSDDQVNYAKNAGVEFEQVHIFNEGFVFFVNKNNPVDSLTVQQLHDIYAGDITNWKQVGGNDEEIIAYQRTEGSGSQTGLYLHVIPQTDVMSPPTEKRIETMGGIVDAVASYDNGSGALGYSYYYFVTNQHFDEQIKLLKIEDIEPCIDTISSGEYPMISDVCAVYRADEPEDSTVRKIADWCLTPYGQKTGKDLGYVPVNVSE